MDRGLEDACMRVGWDTLYERHVPEGLRPENAQGERSARSPFPFSNDHQASFSVNVRSGLWKCWHSASLTGMRGGNYVQFVALMGARVGPDGRPAPDFATAERALRVELGLARPVEPAWLARCQMNLADHNSDGHRLWIGRKPWTQRALAALGIGWDPDRRRLVIPVHNPQGEVANCRMYQPGGDVKMLWSQPGLSGNYLFPYSGWQEQWAVLVEGEPDAITLRCFGYNGVSGTMGAGSPVPEGRWWVGKHIFVWMDGDAAGREAAATAVRMLRDGAASIRVVTQPTWDGCPDNPDPSDFVAHLLRSGMAPEQVQREITRVLGESAVAQTAASAYDAPPKAMAFGSALTSANIGQRIAFPVHVLGKSMNTYSLAESLTVTCPGHGHTWCNTCVMHTQWHGNATLTLDPRAPLTLKLIQTPEDRRDAAFKEHVQIPMRCPEPRFEITNSVDIEIAMFGTTMVETEVTEASNVDRRRHEALIVSRNGDRLEENMDYDVEGFVYPTPKTQQAVFLVDRYARKHGRHDVFSKTPEAEGYLRSFEPNGNVLNSLVAVSSDLERSHTLIRGRLDLHMLMRTVWHSVLAFEFGGRVYRRGWIEAFVVGDTRCGKSATFKALAGMYGIGLLVDCKMQTPAGMLGAVETSMSTGERFVVAGLYPQQDGMGPICMDEFSTNMWDRRSVMEYMSSTRAEGVVRINKAAHATFMARVPSIWMGNPGRGRLMRDIGGYGVEVVPMLISQPEDIARFDVAMSVSQEDVAFDVVNSAVQPTTPRWTQDAHRALLSWTKSRRPDQVCFAEGAEEAVLQLAETMVAKYDADIPLVEPADQRMRIAKLCVSAAAQCHSTNAAGEVIVVRPEHVYAIATMFGMWYDKPSFGYNVFSQRQRIERSILNEAEVEELLDRVLSAGPAMLADRLSRLHEFTDKVFATVIPMPFMDLRAVMQVLSINRCIKVRDVRRGTFELTPTFVQYLHGYMERKGGGRHAR